jgi:hypothetical protein
MRAVTASLALDLGRLHSSGTGVVAPNPDASYVAEAIARPIAADGSKAIVRPMIGPQQDYATPAPMTTRSPAVLMLSLVLVLASRTTFSAPVLAASAKVS